MKKYFLMLVMLLAVPACVLAQSSMTDQQLITFIMEESEKGTPQSEIAAKLMQRGVDIQQIQRVRRKYDRQINQKGMGGVADEAMSKAGNVMRANNGQSRPGAAGTSYRVSGNPKTQRNATINANNPDYIQMQAELSGMVPIDSIALLHQILDERQSQRSKIFGHDLFSNENLTFEPNMNIATPRNYLLGPGDVVNVEIYGASQQSISETITPDGYITVPDFGPIQLAGLTVEQARNRLRSQLGSR